MVLDIKVCGRQKSNNDVIKFEFDLSLHFPVQNNNNNV
jgi:hypothetical protein